MINLKTIGIIGSGKMGQEIFNLVFQQEYSIIWIIHRKENISVLKDGLDKKLRKLLKHEAIDLGQFERIQKNIIISDDFNELKDCDLVIESIIEDENEKVLTFDIISKIVDSNCILSSNTSSIPLENIFKNCENKSRCLGLHLFFPTKFINTIELNLTDETSEEIKNIMIQFIIGIGKKPLVLKKEANFILNRIYAVLFCEVYNIYSKYNVKVMDLENILRNDFFPFGVFNIINSTGSKIVYISFCHFMKGKYVEHFSPFFEVCKILIKEEFLGSAFEKGGVIEYENIEENKSKKNFNDIGMYKDDIFLRIVSVLYNEISSAVKENWVKKEEIDFAVQDFFNLSESLLTTAAKMGLDKVNEKLSNCFEETKFEIYKPVNYSIID